MRARKNIDIGCGGDHGRGKHCEPERDRTLWKNKESNLLGVVVCHNF